MHFKLNTNSIPFVRPWPYPFRAAFSISTDIELTSFEYFEELMRYVNTDEMTQFGQGLALELTSSMFFYCSDNMTFSYFCGDAANAKPSAYHERLKDYLQEGWIDTNHCFGDFANPHIFTRDHALKAYEVLGSIGVTLPVFTNHGGECNVQGIGCFSYRKGDQPGTSQYHSDLFEDHGIEFFWSEARSLEIDPHLRFFSKKGFKDLVKIMIGRRRIGAPKLLEPVQLDDGTLLSAFWRYRTSGFNAPNASSFSYQLTTIDWDALFGARGAIILYQHLGCDFRINKQCYPLTIEKVRDRPHLYLAPYRHLKGMQESGQLWVVGVFRLLRYSKMFQDLQIKCKTISGTQVFTLVNRGIIMSPLKYFQGLTIYVDPQLSVKVEYNNTVFPLDYNGPDETGRYSVTIPITPMGSIW